MLSLKDTLSSCFVKSVLTWITNFYLYFSDSWAESSMTPSGVKSSSRVWQLQCLCWVFQEHGSEISCSLQESRQTYLKQFDFLQRFSRSIDLWPSLFLLTTELQRFLIWLENITYCALFKWSLVSQVSSFLHTALGFHYYISYQPIICK